MRSLLWLILLMALPFAAMAQDGLRVDAQSAVILAYHRIGDDANPAANIRLDQFEAHMRTLKEGGFAVLPLPRIAAALRAGESLPDKAVAITFDGAHRSILDRAVPILNDYDFPYAIFVPTAYADLADTDHLSWAALRKLRDDGRASIGLQSAYYAHLSSLSEEDVARAINNARVRYREEMGAEPGLFAYPFGEISLYYRDLVQSQGFTAAFGQHSGAASPAGDLYALPRFVMTESYGDLERFETAVTALPLPVTSLEPADPYLSDANPAIGFTLPAALADREDFTCFATGTEAPDIERLGEGRIELRFKEALSAERTRINCTVAQSTDDPEKPYRWRWLGLLYTLQGVTDVTDSAEE